MDFDAQLAADLESVELSDLDEDSEDDSPLPELRRLPSAETLLSAAAASAEVEAESAVMGELQRAFRSGDEVCRVFSQTFGELQTIASTLPAEFFAQSTVLRTQESESEDTAGSARGGTSAGRESARRPDVKEAFVSRSAADDAVGESSPWWVRERQQQAEAEAEREAQKRRAAERAAEERERLQQETQRAAAEAEAALQAELARQQADLEEMQALQAMQMAELRERQRRLAEEAAAQQAAEAAAEAAAERARIERETVWQRRQAERRERDAATAKRIAAAEAEAKRKRELAEKERLAQARMEQRKMALAQAAMKEKEKEAQRRATTRVQTAVRGRLARAMRTRLARQRQEERELAEQLRRAAAEAEERRQREAAEAEARRREEEARRREEENRRRKEEIRRQAAAAARREVERRQREEAAATAAAEEKRRKEEEARRKAEEEERRRQRELAMCRAATAIQAHSRRRWAWRRFGPLARAVTRVQSAVRGHIARRRIDAQHGHGAAAMRLQSVWRGGALRRRLKRALEAARFDDDDDFDYDGVDDSWLDDAMAGLDDSWQLKVPDVGHILQARPLSSHGAAGLLTPLSNTSSHRDLHLKPPPPLLAPRSADAAQQVAAGSCSNWDHHASTAAAHSEKSRHATLKDVADEWGFKDEKMAEALMKKRQKMAQQRKAGERKKQMQDPMKRLEALQRRPADPGGQSHAHSHSNAHAYGAGAHHVSQTVVRQSQPGAQGALRRPTQTRFKWLVPENKPITQTMVIDHESLEPAEVPDHVDEYLTVHHNEELHRFEEHSREGLRSFASEPPNTKLARSLKAPQSPALQPLPRVNNFLFSPPSTAEGTILPVGSALHVVRASR